MAEIVDICWAILGYSGLASSTRDIVVVECSFAAFKTNPIPGFYLNGIGTPGEMKFIAVYASYIGRALRAIGTAPHPCSQVVPRWRDRLGRLRGVCGQDRGRCGRWRLG